MITNTVWSMIIKYDHVMGIFSGPFRINFRSFRTIPDRYRTSPDPFRTISDHSGPIPDHSRPIRTCSGPCGTVSDRSGPFRTGPDPFRTGLNLIKQWKLVWKNRRSGIFKMKIRNLKTMIRVTTGMIMPARNLFTGLLNWILLDYKIYQ